MINRDSLILVTGANGFVGSHLTEALLAKGHRVRCMVRPTSDLTFIRDLPVEWAYADVSDDQAVRQACQGVDAVCHCAAITRAITEERFHQINAQGTEMLARAALEANPSLQRFIFVSTVGAAGPSQAADDYVDESRPPHPLNWYGKSKLAGEQALTAMSPPLPLTIIRPAPVFGPRDRDFLTYFKLIYFRLRLELGRDNRRISAIYVRDLVELIILALESKAAVGQIYYGCGPAYTYPEFTCTLARVLKKRALRVVLPVSVLTPIAWGAKVQEWLTGRPALLNEQRILDMRAPYWLCSGQKARQELGFVAQYDLDTALQETAAWYQEHGWL